MLRKPFHGWRIKQEIHKLAAIRTPSPNLNPVRESPGSPTRPTPLTSLSPLSSLFFYCQNLQPASHFRLTHQITKFPLSTSSLATGSAAAYCSRAPEPEPNTHLEDFNGESLRESSDDRRENGGDGEGFGHRRTRVLLFTCVPEDGKCCVYMVWTKHNSQEVCREEERTVCITDVEQNVVESHECPLGTLESLKRNPKVVNKLEVYLEDWYNVAKGEMMKYGRRVMPLSEQVANKLEVYLGRGFRVAYEEAMQYGLRVLRRHFPLEVALCHKMPLEKRIALIRGSITAGGVNLVVGHLIGRVAPSRCMHLWHHCLLQLLEWIQSGVNFGRKK